MCDTVEGKALGHVGGNATCESPAICDRCNNSYGDKADHNWIGATCTEPKHCGVCGTAEGDALGHKGGNATCTDKAICQNCNQAYGEPLGHAWVEATCTEAKHCQNCPAVEGEPLGHKGGTPTCEGPAECEVCDTPYGEPGTHKGGTATCTKGAVCSTCQQEYTAPIGHDWTEASCTDAKHCKSCGATEGAPLGHEGGITNCTTLPVCNICGESYGTTSEHDYTFKNTDASYIKDRGDCTTAPTYYISCSVCGDRDESNTFEGEAPLGHNFGEYETENGVHTRTCTVCHTTESGNCLYDAESGLGSAATCEKPAICSTCAHEYGEALGHDWDEGKVTTVPTCTVPGVKTYNCKNCDKTKTESVDPTGHSFGEFTVTTKPTCTVAGVETAYCSCGEPKTQPISATGHTSGIAATCEASQVCTECTAELAPATGHNYVLVSSTPATCTSPQIDYYECACTKKYNVEVGTPTEHNIKGVTPTKVAVEGKTCEFVQHYKCNDCGTDVKGKTVTNHATWTASITIPATCTTEGVKTLTCESCGETKTEVIAVDTSLGHAWDGGVTADGVTTYSCTRGVCDATKTVKVITSGDKVSGSDLDNEIQVGDDANLGLDDGLKDIIGDQEVSVSSDKITGDDKYILGLTDAQLAQIGNNPVYNFTIEGENGLISDFTGANGEKNYITITIPYELADGTCRKSNG